MEKMKRMILILTVLLAGSLASAENGLIRRPDTPAQDISVQSAVATVLGTGSGCYRAELNLEIIAGPSSAGNYRLRITPANTEKPTLFPVKLNEGLNELKIPEAYFTNLGKNNTRLELQKESGGAPVVREYPVRIAYEPLRLILLKPGYAQTFFPGQNFSRIEGELEIRLAAEGLTAVVSVDGDSIPSERLNFPSPGRTVKFGFDTSSLGFDTCTVTAELRKGNLPIAKVQAEIRRPQPACTQMVWLDASGIIVNRKKILPQGIRAFRHQGRILFPECKAKDAVPLPRSDLCFLEPAWLIKGAEEEAVKDAAPSRVVLERIRRKMAEYQKKDFLFYSLCTGPERRGLSPVYLRHLYEFIKEQDAFHPVMIGTGNVSEYKECADVFTEGKAD